MRVCRACGKENQEDARFCHWCGEVMLVSSATGRLPSQTLLHKGRYAIIKLLGTGGMGAVYKVLDLFDAGQRVLAVKEMSQSGLIGQELRDAIAAFVREADLLSRLDHPSLPRIYQQFEDNGRRYLAMDFIEGSTLEEHWDTDWQQGKLLSVERIVGIGIQLCSVLDYLHGQQPPVIFRDLKPANIMVHPQGQIYLIDFGIARLFRPEQTKDTVALGSPGYASPEQYRNSTSPQSDIYSLGAVLHQLLTGNDPSLAPFRFKPFSVDMAMLEDLVMSMVEADKKLRPASMRDVQKILQRIEQVLLHSKPSTGSLGTRTTGSLATRTTGSLVARSGGSTGLSGNTGSVPSIRSLNVYVIVSPEGQDQRIWKSIQEKLLSLIDTIPNVKIQHSAAPSQQDPAIRSQTIDRADLLLALLSDDLLSSPACMTDVKRAVGRAGIRGVKMRSLLLRPCAWEKTSLARILLAFPEAIKHPSLYAQELRILEAAKSIRVLLANLMLMGKQTGPMNLLQWLLWQLYGSGGIDCPYFVVGQYALRHVRSSGSAGVLFHLLDLSAAHTVADYTIASHNSKRLTSILNVIAPTKNTPLEVQGLASRERPIPREVR